MAIDLVLSVELLKGPLARVSESGEIEGDTVKSEEEKGGLVWTLEVWSVVGCRDRKLVKLDSICIHTHTHYC